MNRFVCIHGHFYQPPRENPWLEQIEVQDSAYPYRDWNERITAECYSPNSAARIQNAENRIIDIINNYSKISFNFGPTLLSWMAEYATDTYNAILEADKLSMQNFSGHGSAIAQVYNHMIMPLSNRNDKETQVKWGVEDFKFRFGRHPEGMWLAETAVDYETLEILAEEGITYTILAPRQAKRVKKVSGQKWRDVQNDKVDPKKAYICKLPSGKTINLFFYDGFISQEIAFGNLLKSGENLANRLMGSFLETEDPQLVHIATDGETYGHHQKHGEMALAYCLHYIESNHLAQITNYGEYLSMFPPEYEAEIVENSSWSCLHGVERWRSNCGCNTGRPGWVQEWRSPLREALDWLREKAGPIYEEAIKCYTDDPWLLRDDYIRIILDRHRENIESVLGEHAKKELSDEDIINILKHLEIQRHAMLMYTSCGWFFDEISGLETVQVVKYAARAIQLIKDLMGIDLEPEFVKLLEKAPSNIPEVQNGALSYEKHVKPAVIDFHRVAAHYAISTLFKEYEENSTIFSYEIHSDIFRKYEAGRQKLVIGRSMLKSRITQEESAVTFAVLHLGDHNINGGVRESISNEAFELMHNEVSEAFRRLNIADIILLLDKHFGTHNYTLWHLFKDESRKVFNVILQHTLDETEHSFRQMYENHYPIMQAMVETGTPLPKAILTSVEYVINTDLRRIFENQETIDSDALERLYMEARKWNISIDRPTLEYVGSKRINKLLYILREQPHNIALLNEIRVSLKNLTGLDLDLDVWEAQNVFFHISREHFEEMRSLAEKEDEDAAKWVQQFREIENYLRIRIHD